MPLQNRVTPCGELIATAARGTPHGEPWNHSRSGPKDPPHQTLAASGLGVLPARVQRLSTPIMGPGSYTELFFLDEATALAAGHRPCAYCRRADFNAFKAAWLSESSLANVGFVSIKQIDRQLHRERVSRQRGQIRFSGCLESLPDGVMIQETEQPHLVWGKQLFPWRAAGYAAPIARPSKTVTVPTPHSTVAALRAGYRPAVHQSTVEDTHPCD